MKYCVKCKKIYHKDSNFCKGCGSKLLTKEGATKKLTQKKEVKGHHEKEIVKNIEPSGKKRNKLIYLFLAVIVIVAVAFLINNNAKYVGRPTAEQGIEQKPSFVDQIIKKAYCGNKVCESGEDSSDCCVDCGCPSNYMCDNNKCKKSPNCGDGVVDEGETSDNCCRDAGCPTGEVCENNACIVLKPEISAVFKQTTESPSVTFLKAKGDGIGEITLSNSGNDAASNVKVVLSSPSKYFSDKTISFGTILEGGSSKKIVDLNFLTSALDVTTNEQTTISADFTFYNSANEKYSTQDSFEMCIAGRNYMTWQIPGMISSWVTPTQPIMREFASKATSGLAAGMSNSDPTVQLMAARWLFESMRAYGVRYVNDAHASGDYIQFPWETLKNKAGDCDDNAVLYASLLESIGLKSFLVLVPGHIFSGYISSDNYAIPIETTALTFDTALSSGASQYDRYKDTKKIIFPTSVWYQYPQVNLPEKTELIMPSITKQIGDCKLSFTLSQGWIAKMLVGFTNSGSAPGAGCAAMIVSDKNRQKIDDDLSCWTINPSESKEFDYIVDIKFGDVLSGYYCGGY